MALMIKLPIPTFKEQLRIKDNLEISQKCGFGINKITRTKSDKHTERFFLGGRHLKTFESLNVLSLFNIYLTPLCKQAN